MSFVWDDWRCAIRTGEVIRAAPHRFASSAAQKPATIPWCACRLRRPYGLPAWIPELLQPVSTRLGRACTQGQWGMCCGPGPGGSGRSDANGRGGGAPSEGRVAASRRGSACETARCLGTWPGWCGCANLDVMVCMDTYDRSLYCVRSSRADSVARTRADEPKSAIFGVFWNPSRVKNLACTQLLGRS